MSRQESANGGTLILAFMAGAVTGAALALLFAPAAGEETRQLLGEKAREGRERANEAAQRSREFLNRQRETVRSAIDRGREAYAEARAGEVPGDAV